MAPRFIDTLCHGRFVPSNWGQASADERIGLTQDKDSPWVFVGVLGWTDMPEVS